MNTIDNSQIKWIMDYDKMGKRTLAYTTIHRVRTTVYSNDDTRILWGKLSYRCRHGNLWDTMGLSDTLIKWQNKHRVVVISVCYLSILFSQTPWQFIRIVYNSTVLRSQKWFADSQYSTEFIIIRGCCNRCWVRVTAGHLTMVSNAVILLV